MHMTRKFFLTRAGALGAVAALALTACGSQTTQNAQTGQNTQTSPSASTSASATPTPITEGKGAASRVAITYDGGVLVYDAKDMKLLADIPKEGFLRLSDAGDNR
ncbi:MAG: hypothetical protein HXO63_08005, partial [Rothia mucilaginosa]|nr:hypothetical protein [Rothia mucilaginosa]